MLPEGVVKDSVSAAAGGSVSSPDSSTRPPSPVESSVAGGGGAACSCDCPPSRVRASTTIHPPIPRTTTPESTTKRTASSGMRRLRRCGTAPSAPGTGPTVGGGALDGADGAGGPAACGYAPGAAYPWWTGSAWTGRGGGAVGGMLGGLWAEHTPGG